MRYSRACRLAMLALLFSTVLFSGLRNPLLEKGLWELSWHERSTLLRQMVDWQCECVRASDGWLAS